MADPRKKKLVLASMQDAVPEAPSDDEVEGDEQPRSDKPPSMDPDALEKLQNEYGARIAQKPNAIKQAKDAIDEGLTEHVVEPLARAGHEDLGAGIATAISTPIDYAVLDKAEDIAMGGMLGGRTMKAGEKAGEWLAGKTVAGKEARDELRRLLQEAKDSKQWSKVKDLENQLSQAWNGIGGGAGRYESAQPKLTDMSMPGPRK